MLPLLPCCQISKPCQLDCLAMYIESNWPVWNSGWVSCWGSGLIHHICIWDQGSKPDSVHVGPGLWARFSMHRTWPGARAWVAGLPGEGLWRHSQIVSQLNAQQNGPKDCTTLSAHRTESLSTTGLLMIIYYLIPLNMARYAIH